MKIYSRSYSLTKVRPDWSVLGFPRMVTILFYIFSLYMVFPLIDLPLLGLSLSAPMFFFIAIPCILKPPRPWFRAYRQWIFLAVAIWSGIFTSAVANGMLNGNIDLRGINIVIHYAYWLLAFVITAYFASQGKVLQAVANLLGWSVVALVLMRWGEVLIFGNMGAWVGTYVLSQNTYGFLFSTYSPFLLVFLITQRGIKRWLVFIGNVLLWGAVAINGSRGSWVAISIGLVLALILLVWSRPSQFLGLAMTLLLIGGTLGIAWVSLPQVSDKVMQRFNTFNALDEEKSYMIRQLMIQKAWRLFQQSPIIGVGANRFALSSIELDIPAVLSYAPQSHFDVKSAHNSYADFLAESGLVGAIPFGILLATLLLQGLWAAQREAHQNRYFALAVFLAFVQMSVHMWAIASLTNTGTWFIYGLVAAVIATVQLEKRHLAERS